MLTAGDEQNITLPAGLQFDLPRLGIIGTAEMHINRQLEFRKQSPELESADGTTTDLEMDQVVSETSAPAVLDPRMLQMLGSLRRAAWFVVCLLALIFIMILLKH